MTKKDYELIASSLNLLVKASRSIDRGEAKIDPEGFRFLINQVVFSFGSKLKEDNPRFDIDKFLQAVNR